MMEKHLVELLTPRQDCPDLDAALDTYTARHQAVVDSGFALSVPDNPMGIVHFQAVDLIQELGIPIDPAAFLLHINTCHTRSDLDNILSTAADLKIRNVLIVTGDGSERLPKLRPADIGASTNSVTSIELLRFVSQQAPNAFDLGVAFNPYEPQDHEIEKLHQKLDAGARFVVTQPIIGKDTRLLPLVRTGVPFIVGAWMSSKIGLLSQCVGYDVTPEGPYDPLANMSALRAAWPDNRLYLGLVGFQKQLPLLRSLLLDNDPLTPGTPQIQMASLLG